MENLKIATAQFENKSGDKKYNLQTIDELSRMAAEKDARVICFHEQSVQRGSLPVSASFRPSEQSAQDGEILRVFLYQ